jgi:hypothetical protein
MRARSRPLLLCLAILGAACSGEPGEASLGPACADGLAAAEFELEDARARGLGESVKWTKAATLIAAARVQEGFEEYRNCVVKVRDARAYLREVRS